MDREHSGVGEREYEQRVGGAMRAHEKDQLEKLGKGTKLVGTGEKS